VVSRSNLIQALASIAGIGEETHDTDRNIRNELLSRLKQQNWTDFGDRNVTVRNGIVHLWGLITSEAERHALTALAESVPGVVRLRDEMFAIY
jgi:osmotically-inducible protein OsmY